MENNSQALNSNTSNFSCILSSIDTLSEEELQHELFILELYVLARHLYNKFPSDTRTLEQLVELIITELLNDSWSTKHYLQEKAKQHG